MSRFRNFSKGEKSNVQEASEVLTRLIESKTAYQVEIEGGTYRFKSSVGLRSGAVVLNYPQAMAEFLEIGNWLRVLHSEAEGQALRLEISSLGYGGSGEMAPSVGEMSLLCNLSGAMIIENLRRFERFNTESFKEINFSSVNLPSSYKILDLSLAGMKIRISEEDKDRFPIGKLIETGTISLGNRASINVVDAKPCHYQSETLGIETFISPEGNSKKLLEVFLDWLRSDEMRLFGTLEPQGT